MRSMAGARHIVNVENAICSLTVFAHARHLGRVLPSNRAEIDNSLTTRQPRIFGPYPRAQEKAVRETSIHSGPTCTLGPGVPNRTCLSQLAAHPPPWRGPTSSLTCCPWLAVVPPLGCAFSSQEAARAGQTP